MRIVSPSVIETTVAISVGLIGALPGFGGSVGSAISVVGDGDAIGAVAEVVKVGATVGMLVEAGGSVAAIEPVHPATARAATMQNRLNAVPMPSLGRIVAGSGSPGDDPHDGGVN